MIISIGKNWLKKKNNWVYSSSPPPPPLKWIGTIFKKIKQSFEAGEQDEQTGEAGEQTEGRQENKRKRHKGSPRGLEKWVSWSFSSYQNLWKRVQKKYQLFLEAEKDPQRVPKNSLRLFRTKLDVTIQTE